jgi:hypothetical protein
MLTIFPDSLIRLRKFCHHWQSTTKNHKYTHWCNGSCQDRQDLNNQHIKYGLKTMKWNSEDFFFFYLFVLYSNLQG